MEFFDDLDATVAEDVEWGDSSDEEEQVTKKKVEDGDDDQPAAAPAQPTPSLAGDTHAADSSGTEDSSKDAGEVGGSSGDYTHPTVVAWIQEKAAIAHDRFYDLKWHASSAPPQKVALWLDELLETLPWLQSDEIPSLAARAGVTAGQLVRFLKAKDAAVVDAASGVIGYLSGQGMHIKRLSFEDVRERGTGSNNDIGGGSGCNGIDGGGGDDGGNWVGVCDQNGGGVDGGGGGLVVNAAEAHDATMPLTSPPPTASGGEAGPAAAATTVAVGTVTAAAAEDLTAKSQLSVDIVELPFAGAGETLGNKIWPSALRLSALCIEQSSIIEGKQVLELGCGPGVPGMVCAQLGVGTVVLTDYVDGVLRNTQKNVDANNCEGRAVVAMLDWLKPETAAAFCSHNSDDDGSAGDMLPVAGFDTVIAADVIYDEWHAEAVPKMCVRFLRRLPADVMAQHPDAIRCLVVLGDRTARRGIPLFEANMLQAGFVLQYSDMKTKMSEYAYSWRQPPIPLPLAKERAP